MLSTQELAAAYTDAWNARDPGRFAPYWPAT